MGARQRTSLFFQVCKLLVGLLWPGLLDPPGIGGVEFVERFAPAHDALSFDEPCGLVVAFAGFLPRRARSRARLSSMLMMASHSSLTTASSPGKWPRFLVTFRSR